jgi:quercetin dioxygenase-like cupin family protein
MTDASDRVDPTDLAALGAELLADLAGRSSGHTARTVVAGPSLRAVVMAIAAGAGLAEHEAPPAATLHCLTGEVTLRSGDQEWPLRAGQLVPIPSARHSVEAHSDAVLLLTVSLA